MSDDLAAFLLACVAEDKQAAQKATPGPWRAVEMYDDRFHVDASTSTATALRHLAEWPVDQMKNVVCESSRGDIEPADARHIANWHPQRVLDECDVRRKVILVCLAAINAAEMKEDPSCGDVGEQTLRLLSLLYTERPGYREEWKPGHGTRQLAP